MKPVVKACVPLKLSSRRLPHKNFLPLAGKPLAWHIINTLSRIPEIDEVCVFASDPKIMSLFPDTVTFIQRDPYLDGDTIKGTELFHEAFKLIGGDINLIAHATSPFISASSILAGLNAVLSGQYDSAFAVQKFQTYMWDDDGTLNYDLRDLPQTQDIKPVYIETSGFYIFRHAFMADEKRRIGDKPFFVTVPPLEAIDIDYAEDFVFAKQCADLLTPSAAVLPTPRTRLFMFDLDGVLIDSKENMRTAWDATREKFGLQPTFNDYLQLIGRPFCDILTLLGIQGQQEAIFNYYNTISAQYVDCITPYEGAYDFLAFLRGKNILTALITSKSKVRLDAVLRKIPHPFSCVLTPEDGLRGKPAPDHLLLACLKLGVDPAEAVYLGDMESDGQAARRASIDYLHAGWGYGQPPSPVPPQFANFQELARLFTDFDRRTAR